MKKKSLFSKYNCRSTIRRFIAAYTHCSDFDDRDAFQTIVFLFAIK